MENGAQQQRIETITEELKNTQSKLRQCKKEKLVERFESKKQNEDLLAKLEDTERKLQEARKDKINKIQDFEYSKSLSDKEYQRKNNDLEMEKLALQSRLKHLAEENEGMKKNMSHQENKLEYEKQKSSENFKVKNCGHQSNEHKRYSEDEENRNHEIARLRSKLADAEATMLKTKKEASEMMNAVKNEKIEADTKYGHELSRIQQSKIDLERRVEKLMKENETQRETHKKNAIKAASKLENMEQSSQNVRNKLDELRTRYTENNVNMHKEIARLRSKLATLSQMKKEAIEMKNSVKNEKTDGDTEYRNELSAVLQSKIDLEGLIETLLNENQKQRQTYEETSIKTAAKLETMQRSVKILEDELDETRTRLQKISRDNKHKNDEIEKLRTLLANVEQTLQHTSNDAKENKKEYNKELSKFQQKMNILKRQSEYLYTENAKLKKHYQQKEKPLSKDMNILEQRLQNTEMELSDAKKELGKCMQRKQVNSNPNIADLSDIHRPTRLADRFQELYDDRWTDAFETLEESNKDEKDIIHLLLTIVTQTKNFCDREIEQQMGDIKKSITQSDEVRQRSIPDNIMKYIKDYRKASFAEISDNVYKKYKRWLQSDSVAFPQCVLQLEDYTKECFELCWLIAFQDQPIVFSLEPKHDDTFQSDVYKLYTVKGTIVDFLVWPALLLHENGPLLLKGVVQAQIPSGVEVGERKRGTT